MSHFSVLVVTETPDQVEEVLQPYYKYECTGVDDEYVQDVDITDEVLADLDEHGDDYESVEEFVKDWHGLKVIESEEEVDYIIDNYGYAIVKDGKILKAINRTNPDRKWDWWVVGGRWSGFLKPKNPEVGVKGETGIMGSEFDSEGVDQSIKSNIDFQTRMDEAAERAAKHYDEMQAIINGRDWVTWNDVLSANEGKPIDEIRDIYHSQSVVKDLKEANKEDWFYVPCPMKMDRQSYIDMKSDQAITTFAVLMDGTWYEKGEMGWFGMAANEKEQTEWNGQFRELLDSIPEDACITIVDCYI